MQLELHILRRTRLIIYKKVKKWVFFDDFLDFVPTPGFPIRDVTDQIVFRWFLFSWTPKTLRIPKLCNFMDIWPIDKELLTFEPIATLRHKWNEKKYEKDDRRQKERE